LRKGGCFACPVAAAALEAAAARVLRYFQNELFVSRLFFERVGGKFTLEKVRVFIV